MANQSKMSVFAPLKNFSYEGDGEIDLNKDLKITRLAPAMVEEIKESSKRASRPLKCNDIENIRNHFNLYKEILVEKADAQKAFEEAQEKFSNAVNALILLRKKNVWIEIIYGIIDNRIRSIRLSKKIPDLICTYKVTKKEALEFKQWWQNFCEVLEGNIYFKRALERFSETKKAQRVDYHLVDYIIAFESLFSEGPGHIRKKISRRTGVFLAKREMREICKNMKKAYKLRCDIVHGKKLDYKEINKYYNETKNYLRNCLIEIVKRKLVLRNKAIRNNFLKDMDIS
ncbi:hypothetical protein ES702_04697 [subsurface metagenome]